MKKSSFYIDVDKAVKLGLIMAIKVYLNGREVKKVIASKSGKNGFVEYYHQHAKIINGDQLATIKKRGDVKISINKAASN